MEDGDFTTPNSPMFGYMDYAFVDRLLDVECWSPTNDGSDILQPDLSNSQSFSFPLNPVPNFEEMSSSSISNPGQTTNIYQDEKEKWSLLPENPSQTALKEEQVADSHYQQDHNSIVATSKTLDQTVKFRWETDELNRILWIKPKVNSGHSATVKHRLMLAMSHLKELNMNRDVLIQMWVPVKKGPNSFLTTVEQPHFFQPTNRRLLNYRDVSEKYEFLADEDSKRAHGLPGRVFLGKVPEWTPDVRFFRQEEYPRVKFAQKYDVRGSIALPIFENGSDKCLGVLEVIMTTEKFNYRPELESICKALETVDLRSSENSNKSQEQARKGSYEAVRPEIINILRTVSEMHDLPLAQTWASCSQQGNGECWNSDQNGPCVSTIDSACYIRDQRVLDFQKACSEHHLSRGRGGIVGKAFETNQPCFATDVREFSKNDYPLAHHAKMFGLCGAVAIRLHSINNKIDEYVLEFYLPTDLQKTGLSLHGRVWQSISTVIQQTCRSLQFITVKDFEPQFLVLDEQTEDNEKKMQVSAATKNQQETTSSLFSHIRGPQEMGKKISSLYREEPSKEFKLSTNWRSSEQAIKLERVFLDCGNIKEDSNAEGISGVSSGGRTPLGSRNAGKRRTDVQKTISLQVLSKYFAGSLKDAAKDIGVCPTTLKRICRQHGIARWPSRKIKKVGHSLKKLQLVMNSVQGAEGSIQLSSFYTNFPELNSPNTPLQGDHIPTIDLNKQSKQHPPAQAEGSMFSSGATSSNSGSTSSSQTSISGHCSPSGAKIATTITEDLPGSLKRERNEANLHISSKKNNSHVRELSTSNKAHDEKHPESLPGLQMAKSRPSRNIGAFKAKATFGEEKVRFTILPNMGFNDLKQEMAKRFGMEEWTKIGIKYLDDDGEWVLLTCDADLEECIDVYRSSESHTVKLSLSHFIKSSSSI